MTAEPENEWWGELRFAWIPVRTADGIAWLQRVWRITSATGQATYEKARTY